MALRTPILLVLTLVLCAAVPGVAYSAAAVPNVIDDPPAIAEPAVPVEDADPVAHVAGEPTAVVAGIGGAALDEIPTAPRTPSSGSLPFTGLDSRQITWMLLTGLVLLSAGATAWISGSEPAPAPRRA